MRQRIIAGVIAGLLVAACGEKSPTDSAAITDGSITYELRLVADAPLPAQVSSTLRITRGRLILHPNGTFSEEATRYVSSSPSAYVSATPDTAYTETTTGIWTDLHDGRTQLKYADRRPAVFDTASATGATIVTNCRGLLWCTLNGRALTYGQ